VRGDEADPEQEDERNNGYRYELYHVPGEADPLQDHGYWHYGEGSEEEHRFDPEVDQGKYVLGSRDGFDHPKTLKDRRGALGDRPGHPPPRDQSNEDEDDVIIHRPSKNILVDEHIDDHEEDRVKEPPGIAHIHVRIS